MPIHKVKGGYKWGRHGHTYATKEGAEKQQAAIYASGYTGDAATQPAKGGYREIYPDHVHDVDQMQPEDTNKSVVESATTDWEVRLKNLIKRREGQ